jgi:hypothetical protein
MSDREIEHYLFLAIEEVEGAARRAKAIGWEGTEAECGKVLATLRLLHYEVSAGEVIALEKEMKAKATP